MTQEKEQSGEGGAGERLNFFDNGGKLLHFDVESGPVNAPKAFPLFSMPRGKVGLEYANKIMDRFNGWDALKAENARLREDYEAANSNEKKLRQSLGEYERKAEALEELVKAGDLCRDVLGRLTEEVEDAEGFPVNTGTAYTAIDAALSRAKAALTGDPKGTEGEGGKDAKL